MQPKPMTPCVTASQHGTSHGIGTIHNERLTRGERAFSMVDMSAASPLERFLTACPRCGVGGMLWQRTDLGVIYLMDGAGTDHFRVCAGVPFDEPAETPQRPTLAPMAPMVAEPVSEPAEPAFDAEAFAAEMDADQLQRDLDQPNVERLLDWPAIRRAILKPITVQRPDRKTGALRAVTIYRGGIGPSPDWSRDWYPADLYRANGMAPDLVATETTIGRATLPPWIEPTPDAMFDYLHRSWADWQRAQHAARPRPRKAPTAPVAQTLTPAAPAASDRALVLDIARMVADVADLVADAKTSDERARYAAIARQTAELARMVAE